MPSTALPLLLLLVALATGVAGLRAYHQGWAVQAEAAKRARVSRGESTHSWLYDHSQRVLRRTPAGRRLELELAAAGLGLGVTQAGGIALGAFVAGTALLLTLFPLWISVLGGLAGLLVCRALLERARNRRKELFIAQLPDLARVLSNASAAGLSLRSALDMAAIELPEPAGLEMDTVTSELRLGQTLDRALANLDERLPSREVGVLVATLVIQQRAGGDLVRALRDMAETLEARKDLRREIRTIMSGAIYTSFIVAILGVGSLFLVNTISPGALQAMADSLAGRVAFVVAGVLYSIGFFLIRRTTRVDT